ncbi:Ail/Lom family outer membrane beta-barrel protein [Escherichia coli]|nr:Ail/Lom family outer membrane beta-barrel protein [Escherichia coli]
MAAVKISGVLKDGAGKPIQNCTIQLKAKRNSTTVLVNTVASENPDEAGRYSMDVEYGQYSVTLLVEGFPPSHAGTITVYEGSRPGTLNDFLGAMTEDDVRPEALRRFELMVNEVARHAGARVTDNKGKTHDVLTGSDDGRHSNTSLAWGAGVQFNPTESVAIDIAYEGSGSGDWRTDGFIVGVGYKF